MASTIRSVNKVKKLLEITEKINHIKDLDSLLDNILLNARKFTNADAGSIYLKYDDVLKFSYTQNDTLAGRDRSLNRLIYSNQSVPINTQSIAGYVAYTGEPLLIDDVYNLDSSMPFLFNKGFDQLSNYRTKSILTIPLRTSRSETIGVVQVINAKDQAGEVVPFTDEDNLYVSFFANNASVAIERAKMTREIILRMIKMAELRDPKETGNHVNRVGAYSIEIYQRWAENRGISHDKIKSFKDILRIASMLHDAGKVAISDAILKKPGKLTDEEYDVMKTHTQHGFDLFNDAVSEMDTLAAAIAYTHHEKFDGTGYPRGLKGEEIPISGRIVAVADVFDALICKRVYKEAWAEEDVLKLFREQSGTHFDPEVVDAFLSITDVINAIRKKYPE